MPEDYHSRYRFQIPSHHPQGFEADVLSYRDYARAICEMLANTTSANTGLTIGIFGDWGMGKSSVLQMVEDIFDKKNIEVIANSENPRNSQYTYNPLIVRFNAWRYAHQEELWLALLRRIFSEIENKVGWFALARLNVALWRTRLRASPIFWMGIFRIIAKSISISAVVILVIFILNFFLISETGRRLGTIGILLAGSTLAFISSLLGHGWNTINAILNDKISVSLPPLTLQGFDLGQAIQIDIFLTDLDAVLENIANRRPIVVLIDDLDRCSPEQVVSILEAVKKFDVLPSNQENSKKHSYAPIAFILAADRRSIEYAVRAHFKDYLGEMNDENRRTFAREYIEKIVQVPFELPPLTSQKLSTFLATRTRWQESGENNQ